MKKAITVVLDTNIYGWHLDYIFESKRNKEAFNAFNLITKIIERKNNVEILATQTVEREIKDAKDPALSQLFYSVIKGVIKNTTRVNELADDYFKACKRVKLHFVTIDDCEILAAATLAGMKVFVTENRKTLNNPEVIKAIEIVNSSKGLKNVKILDSKNALGDIFA